MSAGIFVLLQAFEVQADALHSSVNRWFGRAKRAEAELDNLRDTVCAAVLERRLDAVGLLQVTAEAHAVAYNVRRGRLLPVPTLHPKPSADPGGDIRALHPKGYRTRCWRCHMLYDVSLARCAYCHSINLNVHEAFVPFAEEELQILDREAVRP